MARPRPRAAPDASLFDLVLCGSHDSAAYHISTHVATRAAIAPLRNWPPIRWASYSVLNDFSATQTLSVYEQLRAGVRYLDIRVTKLAPQFNDDRFWTCHGQAVCVPLDDVLSQINAFHLETARESPRPPGVAAPHTVEIPLVLIFRHFRLSAGEASALGAHVRGALLGGCFAGSAQALRATPLSALPRNVVAGLPEVNRALPAAFGHDAWIDTFVAKTKVAFLVRYIREVAPRCRRDGLCVVGWTVTAHTTDVVLRIASGGVLRPALKTRALAMNAVLPAFLEAQMEVLAQNANVVFCDFVTPRLAQLVIDVNEHVPAFAAVGASSSSDTSVCSS